MVSPRSLAGQSWRVGFCVTHPTLLQDVRPPRLAPPLLTWAQILAHHDPVYIAVNCTQYGVARYLSDHLDDYQRHVQVRVNFNSARLARLLTRAAV